MGSTLQIVINYKCCSSDEVDNDDYKEPEKPQLLNQMPTLPEDNIDKLVTISDDSFTTTIPCNFPN